MSAKGKLGILVGGGPAPGINGVIGAAAIEAINNGLEVYGIYEGYKWLSKGETGQVKKLEIGEVSRIVGVEPYVLRYWESEFPQIRPQRANTNQRTYQKKDLEIILEVKRLLYEEKLTIEGARRKLKQGGPKNEVSREQILEELKENLREILKVLT